MRRVPFEIVLIAAVFLLLAAGEGNRSAKAKDASKESPSPLLTIGTAGPNAIKLNVRTNTPAGGTFKTGDQIEVSVTPSGEAYLIAAFVSKDGDVIVLFPNEQAREHPIKPRNELVLFGQDSMVRLRASEAKPPGRIVLYAGTKPILLDRLKLGKDGGFFWVPRSAVKEMGILTNKLEEMARDEGFAREVIAINPGVEITVSGGLMGKPGSGIRSRKPAGILGVAGVKARIPDSKK